MPTNTPTIAIDAELKNRLKREALERGLSLQDAAAEAVRQWIRGPAAHPPKHLPTPPHLLDVYEYMAWLHAEKRSPELEVVKASLRELASGRRRKRNS